MKLKRAEGLIFSNIQYSWKILQQVFDNDKNNNNKESTTFIVKMRIHANLKRLKTTQ